AALTHAVPFISGTPTVLSEIGRIVFGAGTAGQMAYYSLQLSTALILILGANTSYNGFPLLVNFIASDSYLPRPLRTRGHRLVYSNGIYALTFVSALLLVVTRAQVASLIPLYACTVFTGFSMAGAGMTKYHLTHDSPHRRRHLLVAASAFVASVAVTLIFVVTEFSRGAWLVVVCIPLIVFVLTRTNRRYSEERRVLAEDTDDASSDRPLLKHHVVLVLVDSLDLATARAIQLARTLAPPESVRAVHFVLEPERAVTLSRHWRELGRFRIPLELVECPDRRLMKAAAEMTASLAADGETEVTVVLPRRIYSGFANRLLHSNTADRLVTALSTVPNVSATIAPFNVAGHLRHRRVAAQAVDADGTEESRAPRRAPERPKRRQSGAADGRIEVMDETTPIGELTYRRRATIAGKIRAMRVQPWSGLQTLECTLVDGTGAVNVVFVGRRHVPGIEVGTVLVVEGMVGRYDGRLAITNPSYRFATPSFREKPAVS
ncbi:MAG TPA: OB-fold nucleic acid binding domain-containing protein, partial [Acidimicrobiales bacterium]|nr:OB-fold nucleic acid binding domain-containing protein [Acidimicrobiales bacterium]